MDDATGSLDGHLECQFSNHTFGDLPASNDLHFRLDLRTARQIGEDIEHREVCALLLLYSKGGFRPVDWGLRKRKQHSREQYCQEDANDPRSLPPQDPKNVCEADLVVCPTAEAVLGIG